MKEQARFGDKTMLVAGELVEAAGGDWLETRSPATEELLGRVPAGKAEDVDRAVVAAERAWPEWARRTPEDRASFLHQLVVALDSRAEELVDMEVRDTGMTLGRIHADIKSARRMIQYFSGLGLEVKGESVPGSVDGLHFTVREPYGVVGRIVPFNHPLQFAASRMAAPLMAGNAVVIKPPEQSPLSAMALAEMCADIFPPGVVNIVSGGVEAGRALTMHPLVHRLALIGSPATGMKIQADAASVSVKHVTLELGGKNPSIVFPDITPTAAAEAAVAGMKLGHQGQSCGSISRVFLHASLYEEVAKHVVDLLETCRVGDPLDPATQMGPMNSQSQLDKVRHYIRLGVEEGAELLAGGSAPEGEEYARGYWIRPTLFGNVTPEMTIFREEVFGPVLSLTPWTSLDDAVRMANLSEYGLTASVWTKDIDLALSTARRIRSGMVAVNSIPKHFPGVAFGGLKNSGLGTEEGLEELLSYTVRKAINIHIDHPKPSPSA